MKSDEYLPQVIEGRYSKWWGPWTRGKHRFAIGAKPDFWEKTLAVLTATEGGRYGAVNQYDKCILTVGLVQWCERAGLFGTTKLLQALAPDHLELLNSYITEVPDLEFAAEGFLYKGKPVKTVAQQRAAFLGGSSGLKDQWTDAQKEHAWRVCAVMASLWQEEVFRDLQKAYTSPRLIRFVTGSVRKLLFAEDFPTEGHAGALRAAYISFAGNLPAVADRHFRRLQQKTSFREANEEDQLLLALRTLTFEPGIGLYPHRYNAIRPKLEQLFGVDLPDFAEELKTFEHANPWVKTFPRTEDIQRALISLGYDLGPAGDDGKWGPKSRAALHSFELAQKLTKTPDGVPDAESMLALEKAWHPAAETPAESVPLPPAEKAEEPDETPFEEEDAIIPDVGVVEDDSTMAVVVDTPSLPPESGGEASALSSWGTAGAVVAVVVGLVLGFLAAF